MNLRERLSRIVEHLPRGASVTLPADAVRAWLDDEPDTTAVPELVPAEPATWQTRLWLVPPDTRLGVLDVAECVGRSRDWVYRAVNAEQAKAKGREPLPCARLDGELSFMAGAVRDWVKRSELVVNPTPPTIRRAA